MNIFRMWKRQLACDIYIVYTSINFTNEWCTIYKIVYWERIDASTEMGKDDWLSFQHRLIWGSRIQWRSCNNWIFALSVPFPGLGIFWSLSAYYSIDLSCGRHTIFNFCTNFGWEYYSRRYWDYWRVTNRLLWKDVSVWRRITRTRSERKKEMYGWITTKW